MVALADAFVPVRPDLREFPRELQRGVRRVDADRMGRDMGKRFGSGFGNTVKGILGADVIRAAFQSMTGFFKASNAEARESVKVGKVTAQVIKSTGGAAKITASQVSDLATSISNATGKDDELIQSGANLLLTFKNVRNEAGKTNQIFNRATAAAVDLSATGFGSVEGASKMLGKALNDPIRGTTALSRAGVTFSDQQKEQIKTMVRSGNVLGAQKLIMAEVESQVGGVAAASASASEKYAVAAGNFKELVGGALMPVGDAFYNVMSQRVFPALSEGVEWLSVRIPAAVATFRTAFKTGKTEDEGTWLEGIALAARRVAPALQQVAGFVRSNVVPALTTVGQYVGSTLLPAWLGWYKFLTAQMVPILRQVGGFVVSNVVPALRVVARFIVSDVVPGFLSIVETVKGLVRVVAPIIGQIVGVIIGKFSELRPEIRSIWGSVREIITGVMFIVREVTESVTTIIRMIWDRWGKQIKIIVGSVFGTIVKVIAGALKVVAGIIKLAVALIKGDWRGAWDAIKQIFAGVWQAIRAIVVNAFRIIDTVFGSRLAAIRGRWGTFWSGIRTGASNAMSAVHGGITTALGRIRGAFATAVGNIKRVWDGVKGVVSAPIQWVKNNVYNRPLVPVWNRVAGLVNGPKLAAYAAGGVHGVRPGYTPGRDTHVIGVGGGEAVMRPEWTRAVGKDYVDRANRAARMGVDTARRFIGEEGLPPGYQAGGVVGWVRDKLGAAGSVISGLAGRMKDWVLGGLHKAASAILSPLKDVISRNMPNSGVGRTVGGIGHKAVNSLLGKIKDVDQAPTAGAPGGSIATVPGAGWPAIMAAMRRHGARNFTTYPGHHPSMARARDVTPHNWAAANAARAMRGVWYVIYRMMIASKSPGRGNVWRPYHPTNFRGDWRHVRHIHVAKYDGGGFLPPGLSLAYNGTRKPEPVGAAAVPTVIELGPRSIAAIASALTVEIDGRQVARAVRYQGIRGTT